MNEKIKLSHFIIQDLISLNIKICLHVKTKKSLNEFVKNDEDYNE